MISRVLAVGALAATALLVPPSPAAQSAGVGVSIANMAFSPTTIKVSLGDTVTWKNNDSTSHTSTSDQGFWSSGTLSPPAVLASLPFAPAPVLEAMRNLLLRYPQILTDDRLCSGFNPCVGASDGQPWVSAGHYGLDQGIVLMMIENHRSGLVWRTMRTNAHLVRGLRRAGFGGGWLDESPAGP